jgi:hypothetical protein
MWQQELLALQVSAAGHGSASARQLTVEQVLKSAREIKFNLLVFSFKNRGIIKGCQIFLCPNIPKREKYTKWPQAIPNGHKI